VFSRITNRSIAVGSLTNLQASMNRSNKLQEQLSSGQVLSKPSDDPVVTNNSIQYRTEIGVQEQYGRNNLDGQAWLNSADAALQDSVTVMQRVRDLTVQAANVGANDVTARKAAAIEIDRLKETLLSSANTKYLGRPIFVPAKIGDVAFDPAGDFQGDDGVVARRVGPNVDVAANVSGEGAFGTNGATFKMLTELSDKLKSGDGAGIGDYIAKVDTGLGLLKDSLSTVGARTNQLEALKDTSDARVDSLTDSHNEITAIDLPKTLIEYNLQKTAYETALASTAKVIQPTLMDFLR
jgi:flagellar hook-associated protein 3 FlgL